MYDAMDKDEFFGKCATVNKEEYHRLQEVENVVRMGRESRAADWPSRPG